MSPRQSPSQRISRRAIVFASVSVMALTVGGTAARAQTTTVAQGNSQLHEVVVTAERRRSTVQKTAASISVRTGQDMLGQGRLQLTDILEDVPGVSGVSTQSASGNSTTSVANPYANIVIRGVLPDQVGDGSQIPTTAVYADDVYEGIGSDYDIGRVEVLRGPQGTLYGRSATGGVISIHTNDPVIGKFQATVNGTYGNYDLRDLQGAVNLPLASVLALRVSGREFDELGYLNFRDGSQEKTEGRVKLLYQPTADLSVLLGFAAEEDHNHTGGPGYQEVAPNDVQLVKVNPVTAAEAHQHQFWAEVNYNLGPATLTYIPSFRRLNTVSPAYVGPAAGVVGYNPSVTPFDQYITQEARITSNGNSQLTWLGGVFYYNEMSKNDVYLNWLASGAEAFATDQRKITQDVGVFGESTYAFDPTLRFTAGLRYDYTAIDHTETYVNNATRSCGDGATGMMCGPPEPTFGLPEKLLPLTLTSAQGFRSFNDVTYKVRLEKDLTPVNMVYGSVASGFLPGDVQVGTYANGQPYPNPYNQETLTAFEIGSKNRFLDNTLQANVAAYYYLYSGYQQDVELTPSVPGSAHITFGSPARMYGLDFEATYRVTPVDSFHVTAGLIRADFTGDPSITVGGTSYLFSQAVAQKAIAGIPPITATAAYDHTFNLPDGSNINGHADMQYFAAYDGTEIDTLGSIVSKTLGGLVTYASAEPFARIPSQVLGNFAVVWTSANSKYSFGGFVRNVGDTVYKSGLDIQYDGSVTATPTIVRTYGMTAHLSY